MKSTDWIGFRQGKLRVVAFVGVRSFAGGGRATMFRFQCECGAEFVAQKSNIVGKRMDCGCSKIPSDRTFQPGSSKHPLHKVWWQMIDRCENSRNTSFKNYGVRGISACVRWKSGDGSATGFECFLSDMGPRPKGGTIERVLRDGNYEPGNCIWLPKAMQSKNRRGVKLIRIGRFVKTIPEWCLKTGVPYFTAIVRIRRGWPPDVAVTKLPRRAA
jgi:hypothetical protein